MTKDEELPKFFREVLNPLQTEEQRDIALLASLAMFPAFFPKAHFKSVDKVEKLGLYVVIILPPASGKKLIDSLGGIVRPTEEQCQRRRKGKSFKVSSPDNRKLSFMVPGNITASRFAQKLSYNNENPLLMIESELDTLTNSSTGEHGKQLSVILRQSYESELISLSRKTDDEDIYIPNPWVSLVFAGTIDSLSGFFKGNQDGLFSRFLVYAPNKPVQRRSSVVKSDQEPLDIYYRKLGENLLPLYDDFFSTDIEVCFSQDQYQLKDDSEIRWESEFSIASNQNFASVPRRSGARAMKIASTLTIARYIETKPDSSKAVKLQCTDDDLRVAIDIVDKLLDDSHRVFVELGGLEVVSKSNTKVKEWIAKLPGEFNTRQAVLIAGQEKIPERSTKKYLKDLHEAGVLEKVSHGYYRKALTRKSELIQN